MVSRGRPPDAPDGEASAEDIIVTAVARALGSRRRMRLLAVALWCGFLGAILAVGVAVAILPENLTAGAGWRELSLAFFCAWALALVPVTLALMLGSPPPASPRHRPDHGH